MKSKMKQKKETNGGDISKKVLLLPDELEGK